MFGDNPIRKPVENDGKILQIQEIFKTFQGEGPYTGVASIFIRLGGCNLACNFCDTEFESFSDISIDSILNQVDSLSGLKRNKFTHKLVVITGGEPFRQSIELLCLKLLNNGYKVQIETNGTLYRNIDERVDIICSPKNTGNGYQKIRPDLLKRLMAIKFIISASNKPYDNFADVGQGDYNIPVYLQPMDEYEAEKNSANIAKVTKLAETTGYRISLQTHKIAGVK